MMQIPKSQLKMALLFFCAAVAIADARESSSGKPETIVVNLGEMPESSKYQRSVEVPLGSNTVLGDASFTKSCGCLKAVNLIGNGNSEKHVSSITLDLVLNTQGKTSFDESVVMHPKSGISAAVPVLIKLKGTVKPAFELSSVLTDDIDLLLDEERSLEFTVSSPLGEKISVQSRDSERLPVAVETDDNGLTTVRITPSAREPGFFFGSLILNDGHSSKIVPIRWSVRHSQAAVGSIALGVIQVGAKAMVAIPLHLPLNAKVTGVEIKENGIMVSQEGFSEESLDSGSRLQFFVTANTPGRLSAIVKISTSESADSSIPVSLTAFVTNAVGAVKTNNTTNK